MIPTGGHPHHTSGTRQAQPLATEVTISILGFVRQFILNLTCPGQALSFSPTGAGEAVWGRAIATIRIERITQGNEPRMIPFHQVAFLKSKRDKAVLKRGKKYLTLTPFPMLTRFQVCYAFFCYSVELHVSYLLTLYMTTTQ